MRLLVVVFTQVFCSTLDLSERVECFTCGQNNFFSSFTREKGSHTMCKEIITQKHLRQCPRSDDVCKTKITRQRHFNVDGQQETINTTIVTIERSCAHRQERPLNFVEEKKYKEKKEIDNGLIIEEIEEIFCTNDACNHHEASNYYQPPQKQNPIYQKITDPAAGSSSSAWTTISVCLLYSLFL